FLNILESLNYLSESDIAKSVIDDLAADTDYDVTIKKTIGLNSYNPRNQTIKHLVNFGLEVKDQNGDWGIQSPAVGLLHELGHAKEHRDIIREFGKGSKEEKRFMKRNHQEALPEEERIVSEIETPAAKELNERLNVNEGTRESYKENGSDILVTGPTSTTPKRKVMLKDKD
ncbi:MAG: hypothetical protein AAFY76_12395, partial [Cyanobacteria bacterium J06649_11]